MPLWTVLIANKATNLIKRSSRVGMVCKLDIEKAYDYVNWKWSSD